MAKVSPSQAQSISDIHACVSTSNGLRPAKSSTLREWLLANQIGISLTLFSMLVAVHNLYPSLRPYTAPFFQLSYYNASKGTYVQGWDDIYFVASAAVALTGVRAIAIEWVLQPLSRRAGMKRKSALRCAEQSWSCMCYTFIWSYGLYLWYNSSYWNNYAAIWADWPARDMSGTMKWYLLVQVALWIEQILVIHLEERRKDHYQMFLHHIITTTLLSSAYVYGLYNVANVVLCLMDVIDAILPAAKVLKYFKFKKTCNVMFGVMLVTWIFTRHICYPRLCWSIYKVVPSHLPYGCYSGTTAEMISTNGYPDRPGYLISPFKNLDGPICMNRTVKWTFLSSLLSLQVLSILWFAMVLRVAFKVVRGGNAEDSRSDDEEEEENSSIEDSTAGDSVSETSSAGNWHASNGVRTRGRGRVPLAEQSDRKALLRRIGCNKPM